MTAEQEGQVRKAGSAGGKVDPATWVEMNLHADLGSTVNHSGSLQGGVCVWGGGHVSGILGELKRGILKE